MPWPKGKKRSAKTKQKISQKLKGKSFSEEHRANLSLALRGANNPMFGRTHSAETKEKMLVSKKAYWESLEGKERKRELSQDFTGKGNPFYGKQHTKESKQKMSISHMGNPSRLGLPHLDTTRRKISEANKGHTAWNKGKQGYLLHSEESRQKISEATRGDRNPNWRGGISFEPYGVEFNEALKYAIRQRDDFECQLCGLHEEDNALDVHHIDYDKTNNTPYNLISLCHGCHTKTGFNRKYWESLFQSWRT